MSDFHTGLDRLNIAYDAKLQATSADDERAAVLNDRAEAIRLLCMEHDRRGQLSASITPQQAMEQLMRDAQIAEQVD